MPSVAKSAPAKTLDGIAGKFDVAPADEVAQQLLSLRAERANDEEFVARIDGLLTHLQTRERQQQRESVDGLKQRTTEALESGHLGRAERLLGALDKRLRLLRLDTSSIKPLRTRIEAASNTRHVAIQEAMEKAKTRTEKFAILTDAWAALRGTRRGDQLASQLQSLARITPEQRGATATTREGESGRPTEIVVPPEIVAEARTAQEHLSNRRWTAARDAYKALADNPAAMELGDEAKRRLVDIGHVMALIEGLGVRVAKKPLKAKFEVGGMQTIVGASDVGLSVEKNGGTSAIAWDGVSPKTAVRVLKPRKLDAASRIDYAVLTALLGDGERFTEVLAPLFADGDVPAAALAIVARHRFGLDVPPEGGYRLHEGAFLDQAAYARAIRRERIATLNATVDKHVEQLGKLGAFKKLNKMEALRSELDKARRYALLAIFNEKHYPYPYDRGSKNYQAVKKEVAKRTAAVRTIWEDGLRVRIKRDGRVGTLLDELEAAVAELESLGANVDAAKTKTWRFLAYATGSSISIQSYFKDERERQGMAYDRWVRDAYNPARTEEAKGEERLQVRITNDYRHMMGYAATVRPGDADYSAITDASVVNILDAGTIVMLVPTRAVRIDNRLVGAARFHSADMANRGYFSHYAKPNPRTGEGTTAPHERMQKFKYFGSRYSENIATNGSAQGAHEAWITSSGHHRNLLSPWEDLGVGHFSNRWTQNFASGGGGKPVIQKTTEIAAPRSPGR